MLLMMLHLMLPRTPTEALSRNRIWLDFCSRRGRCRLYFCTDFQHNECGGVCGDCPEYTNPCILAQSLDLAFSINFSSSLHNLSEDPGPHAVFFSCVRRAGRGVGYPGWSSSSSSSTSIPHIRLVSHT